MDQEKVHKLQGIFCLGWTTRHPIILASFKTGLCVGDRLRKRSEAKAVGEACGFQPELARRLRRDGTENCPF